MKPEELEPAEVRRIARTISTVENQTNGYEDILAQAYRLARWAEVIGITGPPGTGKSTLVDALTAQWAAGGSPSWRSIRRARIPAAPCWATASAVPVARDLPTPISAACRRAAMPAG